MSDLRMFIPFFVFVVLLLFYSFIALSHPALVPFIVILSIITAIFGGVGLAIKYG